MHRVSLKWLLLFRYGYHVLWLPPYHPDLNPIEEAWGITKGHVAYENDGSDFAKVKALIIEGMEKAGPAWPKLVRRTMRNEAKYIREDRIRLNERPGSPLLIETETETETEDEEEDEEEELVDLSDLEDGI